MSRNDELKSTFFQESEDLLEHLIDGLEKLDTGFADTEIINSIFRAVHSIKGGAGAFRLKAVVKFAHHYENVLDALRNGDLKPSPPVLDVMTRAADRLSDLVEAARDGHETDNADCARLIAELCSLVHSDGADLPQDPQDFRPVPISNFDVDIDYAAETVYKIYFTPAAGLYWGGNEASFLLRDLCALGDAQVLCDPSGLPDFASMDPSATYLAWEIELRTDASELEVKEVFEFVDGLCELSIRVVDPKPEALHKPDNEPFHAPSATNPTIAEIQPEAPDTASHAQKVATTIRVDLERVDRMINLVGELVINQAMLTQCLKKVEIARGGDVDVGLDELRTLTRQIQDSVMSIRAQPVKALFQRMSRIAREAGAEVEKSLRVETEGAATEIDKTVIEKLADPLTHMIRNAVDHGLEPAEKRVAAGKDPIGTIRLSAAHLSGRVVIEISDDGAGIDRERIRRIAEKKQLIAPGAQMTPSEVDNLIFLPGFSSADALSKISGRGVGMDVVKRSIQSLGGRITITSQAGKGSKFNIVLPLTLAVLEGMVVSVGGQTVVVPISAIVETMRLNPSQVFKIGTQNSVVRIRGSYVPIVDVGATLGYRPRLLNPESCVFLLVETSDGVRAALLIDAVHDQRQVVIKGLEKNYGHVPGVAAATILGDGRIALILDPFSLVGAAAIAPGLSRPSNSLAAAE